MKKVLTLAVLLITVALAVNAQSPQQFNYQAIVRNAQGQPLLAGTVVALRFTIHDATPAGTVVFQETTTATTNQFGLVTHPIGSTASMSGVNWGSGGKYLQVEVDINGGTNFTDMGTSQLLSVPYALYAANVVNGNTGPTGPQGAQGPTGEQGPTGAQGLQGIQGNDGATGAQGPTGEQGPTGAQGLQGIQGNDGATGAQGPTGEQGPTGAQGVQGIPGNDGATGAQGPTGEQGPTGAQGVQGIPGNDGATGAQGPTGEQGPTGAQGVQGIPGNDGATGAQGPTGEQGPTGAQGAQGIQGNNGATGAQGPTGATGPQGNNGTTGPQGPTGAQGAQGIQGNNGAAGAQGPTGATGPQGNNGATGPQGPTGAQGNTGSFQSGTNTGDIVYWNGSNWAILPIGTAGQVLTVSNTGLPVWAAPQGIIQLTTTAVSSITYFTASGGGSVTSDGGSPITARGICWGTSPNPTTSNSFTTDGSGVGVFTSSLTGLLAGTTYYVRAYATNVNGTSYGNQITFATVTPTVPTLTTTAISAIRSTQANSGGNVTNENGATVTARGVCYSTSPNPTIANSIVASGSGLGSFSVTMSGLTTGTTYYVRAYATNTAGTAYGSEFSFVAALGPGDSHQGGVVAYIFQPGDPDYVAGETHGFVIGPNLGLAPAGCRGTVAGTSTALGSGEANTNAILTSCSTAGIAARLCDDYVSGIYTDWYLPSIGDYNAIYPNRDLIGGWQFLYLFSTSSEATFNASNSIFSKDLFNGSQTGSFKDVSIYVRPIRTF